MRIDKLAANLCVAVAQQRIDRHVGEFGIAVVCLAIGEGKLGGFDHRMNVVGGVVAHRGEIDTVENAQGLQQHRSLAPGAAAMHGDVAELHALA